MLTLRKTVQEPRLYAFSLCEAEGEIKGHITSHSGSEERLGAMSLGTALAKPECLVTLTYSKEVRSNQD